MNPRLSFIAVVVGLWSTSPALAQWNVVSADRTILTQIGASVVSRSAPNLESWTDSMTYEWPYDNFVSASQTSVVTPITITSTGFASVTDGGNFSPSLSGRSTVDVTFDLLDSAPFTFVGSWSAGADGDTFWSSAAMSFERLSPDPLVLHASAFRSVFDPLGSQSSASVNLAGILIPGQYRVRVTASIGGGTPNAFGPSSSSHNMTLTIPTPGVLAALAIASPFLSRRRRR